MQTLDVAVESRFTLLARAMRTLVDLLHTEQGYARIFYDQDGYSYELHSYQHPPTADLFTRMLGYASIADATEAARETLSATHAGRRGRTARASRGGTRRRAQPEVLQLILPVGAP